MPRMSPSVPRLGFGTAFRSCCHLGMGLSFSRVPSPCKLQSKEAVEQFWLLADDERLSCWLFGCLQHGGCFSFRAAFPLLAGAGAWLGSCSSSSPCPAGHRRPQSVGGPAVTRGALRGSGPASVTLLCRPRCRRVGVGASLEGSQTGLASNPLLTAVIVSRFV